MQHPKKELKMKPRILLLINSSEGLFIFRQDLIKALRDKFDVFAITPDNGWVDELREIGCHVIVQSMDCRGKNPIRDLGLLWFYIRAIKQIGPVYVITYTVKPNIYGGIAARLRRIPYAVNITGLGTGFQTKKLRAILIRMYRCALRSAAVVFCENSSIRDEIISDGIAEENRICVLQGLSR